MANAFAKQISKRYIYLHTYTKGDNFAWQCLLETYIQKHY